MLPSIRNFSSIWNCTPPSPPGKTGRSQDHKHISSLERKKTERSLPRMYPESFHRQRRLFHRPARLNAKRCADLASGTATSRSAEILFLNWIEEDGLRHFRKIFSNKDWTQNVFGVSQEIVSHNANNLVEFLLNLFKKQNVLRNNSNWCVYQVFWCVGWKWIVPKA